MLTVVTWLWGSKFGADDVAKLFAGVRRNLRQPARFICLTDQEKYFNAGVWSQSLGPEIIAWPIRDRQLTQIKGCYARLRMFDPEWQDELDITDRIACVDLDTVITGPLDPVFDRPEPFVIMQGGNATNPCKFNGALMMLRAGAHPEVWSDFTVEKASKVPFFEFPDDQGWIWQKLPNAAAWICGVESGVFVFHKPGWPNWSGDLASMSTDLPKGARIVTFSGWRSPQKFERLDWVRKHWRA